ncbi:MAG: molybdopterin-dependent oxidoreductase [Candidatus Aegiribacteria sp.]|nr:molybdopterin-dependent oxidoreductase [Candidatus Aegiribacteria sp.]
MREHLDIATVNTAAQFKVENGKILEADLSAGGVAPVPLFLRETSSVLKGKLISIDTVLLAADTARQEVEPIDDVRGSAEYKEILLGRLITAHFIELFPDLLDVEELVGRAYSDRVSLSSQAHYATPGLYFNNSEEKGRPFAYHVAGTALTEVTLDRLRGTYSLDSVKIVHDCGTSINPLIDRGQIEGGLLQGIGWVTLEELKYSNETHALLSDSLATYKIPDIYFVPDEVQIEFLENLSENGGILNSKAIGEPPFMYGIGTYFALLNALRECNPGIEPEYSTPLSTEKMLLLLEQSSN